MPIKTDTSEATEFQWMRVREAITTRFPDLDRDGLAECPNDVDELVRFVDARVPASSEEVQSVVEEFAPVDSVVDQVAHATSEVIGQATESAQFAYLRADECIAKRPTESVLTSFVAGIALGAMVTALWMKSQPEPSTWDRVKQPMWR